MSDSTSITMKDIARDLGVSVATVSRALKDSPRISAEKREEIKRYAREHNFFPNIMLRVCAKARCNPSKSSVSSFPSLTTSTSRQSSPALRKKPHCVATDSW